MEDEEDEGGEGAGGAGAALQVVQEDHEIGDEGVQLQLPDMAKRRCARHTDSAVAIAWSPQQPQVVVSGGCDDHAYIWRTEQDGACPKFTQLRGTLPFVLCMLPQACARYRRCTVGSTHKLFCS